MFPRYGCRPPLNSAPRRWSGFGWLLLAWIAGPAELRGLAAPPVTEPDAIPASTAPAEPTLGTRLDFRIELDWRGEVPRRWSGRVEYQSSAGEDASAASDPTGLDGVVNLTPGPLLVGNLFASPEQIEWGPPARRPVLAASEDRWVDTAHLTGGISFRVRGLPADRLRVWIDGRDGTNEPVLDLSLHELVDRPEVVGDWPGGWAVSLRRVPGQELRLRLNDGQTVFSPGQQVDVRLEGLRSLGMRPVSETDPEPADPTPWQLDWVLRGAVDGERVAEGSWPIEPLTDRATAADFVWTVPELDGAFVATFRCRQAAESRRGNSRRVDWSSTVTRAVQSGWSVLPLQDSWNRFGPVVAPAQRDDANGPPQTTFSIAIVDEASSKLAHATTPAPAGDHVRSRETSWRSLGVLAWSGPDSAVSRLLPGAAAQWVVTATGKATFGRVQVSGRKMIELAAGEQVSLPAPVRRVGLRHRAIVRVPKGIAIDLAVQPLDFAPENLPNSPTGWGAATPLGPALVILRNGYDEENVGWHESVIDYWPRSKETRLAFVNRWTDRPVRLGEIEVLCERTATDTDPTDSEELTAESDSQDSSNPSIATAKPPRQPASPTLSRLTCLQLELRELFDQFGPAGQPTLHRPLDYHQVWITADRLIETLRREGFNGVILTVASDGDALYPTRHWRVPATWNANWRSEAGSVDAQELLLRRLARAGLHCIPAIRPGAPDLALEERIRNDLSAAASIPLTAPLAGQLGAWSFDAPEMTSFGLYDPSHPAVTATVTAMLVELQQRSTDHRSVHAIAALADERSLLKLPPPEWAGPATLERFRISLGDAAPSRGELNSYLRRVGNGPLERWMGDQIAAALRHSLDQFDGRPLWLLATDNALPAHLVALANHPRILTARLHRRSLIEPTANRVRDETCSASVSLAGTGAVTPLTHELGLFHQPISRAAVATRGLPTDDRSTHSANLDPHPRVTLTPRLDDTESAIAIAQLLGRSDRLVVARGGGGIHQPGGEVRRNSLRRFAMLPPVAMEDVRAAEPVSAAIRLRQGTFGGETYYYLVNLTRWPLAVETVFANPISAQLLDPVSSTGVTPVPPTGPANDRQPPAARRQVDLGRSWQVTLAPGELVAIRVPGNPVAVVRCQARFAGSQEQLASLRQSVQHAIGLPNRIAMPYRLPQLVNLGFEDRSPEGIPQGIPGWLVAQHPIDCVAIDGTTACEGRNSIRLTGQADQGRGAWFVSPVLQAPSTGRLMVSLRLRGEPGEPAQPAVDGNRKGDIQVRIALEGTVAGTPVRQFRTIAVPRDGKWNESAESLEITRLPNLPIESLRLTVDLVSPGSVWVDDVRFWEDFMTAAERAQWDQLVYVAAGGLSRGDLVGASRLLDAHWSVALRRPDADGVAMASFADESTGKLGTKVPRGNSGDSRAKAAVAIASGGYPAAILDGERGEEPVPTGSLARSSDQTTLADRGQASPIRTTSTEPVEGPRPTAGTHDGRSGMLNRLKSWLPKRVAF